MIGGRVGSTFVRRRVNRSGPSTPHTRDERDGPMTEPYDSLPFEQWYAAEWPRVVALIRTVTLDVGAAEDVAAIAFYKAYTRWDRLSNPSGWVRTVALNEAKRTAGSVTVHRSATGEALEAETGRSDLVLVEALDLLSPLTTRQRTVVALRYLYDMTQAQIADELGIAPGTVAATLTTSRRKLANQLSIEE